MTKFNFKLAIYPNPMREDGVFVCEDKQIEPYENPGPSGPLYPAIPQTEFRINSQIEPEFAAEIVRRWNIVETKE